MKHQIRPSSRYRMLLASARRSLAAKEADVKILRNRVEKLKRQIIEAERKEANFEKWLTTKAGKRWLEAKRQP